jgi:hypothetical protein
VQTNLQLRLQIVGSKVSRQPRRGKPLDMGCIAVIVTSSGLSHGGDLSGLVVFLLGARLARSLQLSRREPAFSNVQRGFLAPHGTVVCPEGVLGGSTMGMLVDISEGEAGPRVRFYSHCWLWASRGPWSVATVLRHISRMVYLQAPNHEAWERPLYGTLA